MCVVCHMYVCIVSLLVCLCAYYSLCSPVIVCLCVCTYSLYRMYVYVYVLYEYTYLHLHMYIRLLFMPVNSHCICTLRTFICIAVIYISHCLSISTYVYIFCKSVLNSFVSEIHCHLYLSFIYLLLTTQPTTNKLHNIIEKTALFISQQGTQMEIRIKINQKNNPYFAFMDFNDRLHPYYKHLLRVITSGNYTPKPQVEQKVEKEEKKDGAQQLEKRIDRVEEQQQDNEEDEEDEDSDGDYELHPLLMGSRATSSNATSNNTDSSSQLTSSANGHSGSVPLIVSRRSENHCLCLFFLFICSVQNKNFAHAIFGSFSHCLNYF